MLYRLRLTNVNRPASSLLLFVAGLFIGAATTLNIIGSQSYLLSTISPVYLLYVTAASGILFSVILKLFSHRSIRTSNFAIIATLFSILALYSLYHFSFTPFYYAVTWSFIAFFTAQLFFWIMDELIIGHVNPSKAPTQLYYIFITYEIGTFVATALLRWHITDLPPLGFILAAMGCYGGFMLVMLLSFTRKRHSEIHYHSKSSPSTTSLPSSIKRTFMWLVITSFLLGIFEMLTNHSINLTLQDELQHFSIIRDTLIGLYLVGSLILMALSGLLGRIMHHFRFSLISILSTHVITLTSAILFALFYTNIKSFIALQIILWVAQHSLHHPALQLLHISFTTKQRSILAASQQFAYMVLPNIMLALLLTTTIHMAYEEIITPILYGIITVGLCTLILLKIDFNQLISTLKKGIDHGSKEAAILAIDSLSYLHPKQYAKWMIDLLAQKPKKLLARAAITGLSYHKDNEAITPIIQAFDSPHVEIQLAVIDSLQRFHDETSIAFIGKVASGEIHANTIQVRIAAAKSYAVLTPENALSLLTSQLQSEDERTKANAIEALGTIGNKKVKELIFPFLQHPNLRIKTNAIIALHQLNPKDTDINQPLITLLTSPRKEDISSGLYALGVIKEPDFVPYALALTETNALHDPMTQRCFAFALTQMDIVEGYSMYEQLFDAPYDETSPLPFIHMFSQIERSIRFDVIEYLIRHHMQDKAYLFNLYQHLKYCSVDFHKELDYLYSQLPQEK